MADIIQIEVTPGQFAQAVKALEAPNNGVNKFTSTTDDSIEGQRNGNVETNDINFSYDYDGSKLCTVTITRRNSFMAKLASLDAIRKRLTAMLSANAT